MATITSLGFNIRSDWDGSGVKSAVSDLQILQEEMRRVSGAALKVDVVVDTDGPNGIGAARRELDMLEEKMRRISGASLAINIRVDAEEVNRAILQVQTLNEEAKNIGIKFEIHEGSYRAADARIALLVRDRTIDIHVDTHGFGGSIDEITNHVVKAEKASEDFQTRTTRAMVMLRLVALAAGAAVSVLPAAITAIGAALSVIPGIAAVALGGALLSRVQAVKDSFQGLKDTILEVGDRAVKPMVAPALEQLQKLKDFVRKMEPELTTMFQGAGKLLAPLTDTLTGFITNIMPGFNTAIGNSVPLFNGIQEGVKNFGTSLSNMFAIMSTKSEDFGMTWNLLFTYLGRGMDMFGRAAANMAHDANQSLGDTLMSLEEGLDGVLDGLQGFIAAVGQAQGGLGFFKAIGDALRQILPAFGQLYAAISTTLAPALSDVANGGGGLIRDLFTALVPIVEKLAPVVTSLGGAFKDFSAIAGSAMDTLSGPISTIVDAISGALAPVIDQLPIIIAPVVDALANGLGDAMTAMAPVITEVATQLGTFLTGALSTLMPALMPVIQALADGLLQAIIDLTPSLLQLMPSIVLLAQAFTGVLLLALNILVPIINTVLPIATRVLGIALGVLSVVIRGVATAVSAVTGYFDRHRVQLGILIGVISTLFIPTMIKATAQWIMHGIQAVIGGAKAAGAFVAARLQMILYGVQWTILAAKAAASWAMQMAGGVAFFVWLAAQYAWIAAKTVAHWIAESAKAVAHFVAATARGVIFFTWLAAQYAWIAAKTVAHWIAESAKAVAHFVAATARGVIFFAWLLGQYAVIAARTAAHWIAETAKAVAHFVAATARGAAFFAWLIGQYVALAAKTAAHWIAEGAKATASFAVMTAKFLAHQAVVLGGLVKQAAAWVVMNARMLLVNGTMLVIRTATMAWTAAQWLLNVALNANPISLIIIAIAGLVAAIVFLATKTRFFQTIWEGLKIAWQAVITAIKVAWDAFAGAITAAWEAVWGKIKVAGEAIWNGLRLGWELLWNSVRAVWDAFSGAIRAAWDALWNGIKVAFDTWKAAVQLVWETLWNLVKSAWDNFANAMRAAWDALWNGIKAVGETIWNGIKTFWDNFINGIKVIWEAFKSFITDAWNNLWNGIKSVAEGIWNGITNGFTAFKDNIVNTVQGIVDKVKEIWDRITSVFQGPIDAVKGIWNGVAGAFGLPQLAIGGAVEGFAEGGKIRGRGTGTSDDIPAMLSNGEHVWTAREVEAAGGHDAVYGLRKSVLAGGQNIGLGRREDDNRMATGGMVQLFDVGGAVRPPSLDPTIRMAREKGDGRAYVYGGSGPDGFDCSGYMSAIFNSLTGRGLWGRSFSTESDFNALGFANGLGAGFSIGVMRGGGGPNSHMAGTLDGVNVESGGGHNSTRYGGPAAGADHNQFPLKWHLPIMNGAFVSGGAGSGSSGPSPEQIRQITEAKEKIQTVMRDSQRAALEAINAAQMKYAFNPGSGGYVGAIPTLSKDYAANADIIAKMGVADAMPPSGTVKQGVGAMGKLDAALASMSSIGGTIPDGERLKIIEDAMRITNTPPPDTREAWLAGMNTLITRESGWNAGARNDWDSNAAMGQNSVGLAQVIPSTFEANKAPGYDNIYGPVDNVAASINYIKRTYGSIGNVQQANANMPPKGYATGTRSAAAGWSVVGEQGPELVKFSGGETVKTFDEIISALKTNAAGEVDRIKTKLGTEFDAAIKKLIESNKVDANAMRDALDRCIREAVAATGMKFDIQGGNADDIVQQIIPRLTALLQQGVGRV